MNDAGTDACRAALAEAGGDVERAVTIVLKSGLA